MSALMAKQKGNGGGPDATEGRERRTAPIQVERDLARMAAVIASHRGIRQADVVDAVLRPFLRAQYQIVQQEMNQELREEPPAGG